MQGLHFPFVLFNKRNSPAASSDTLKDVCIVVLKTQLDSTLSDAAFRADSPGRGRGPGPAAASALSRDVAVYDFNRHPHPVTTTSQKER